MPVFRHTEPAEPRVAPGDVDPMSVAAASCKLPLCRAEAPASRRRCTRAAGHSENARSKHVTAPGPRFVAIHVWRYKR